MYMKDVSARLYLQLTFPGLFYHPKQKGHTEVDTSTDRVTPLPSNVNFG